MENSIETIWKEGFLHEENLVVPRVNDLYNRKSIHLVDRLKRRLRFNLIMILVFAFLFPVMGYFMQVIWQGAAASVLLFLTTWYRSEEHTSELQSRENLVCRLLLEKKKSPPNQQS